ncbi:MAG: hypothetical protein RLZZ596_1575 [Pseudomonadota bacterium]
MSAVILNFAKYSKLPAHKARIRWPRKRVYYLGSHSYSGMPGCSWTTDYWIKRIGNGHLWELYCTEEGSRTRLLYGVFDRLELKRYFESVQFEVDADYFEAIGIPMNDEVINLDEYR